MKIAVTGGKGGTGKSTVSTALAVEFAKEKKTMLVDADAECPNAHLQLSAERKKEKTVYQIVPEWDMDKCTKCGQCAQVCKQDAIVFVEGKYPAFVKDRCIGCKACIFTCPEKAIKEGKKEIGTIYSAESYGLKLIQGELKVGELASGEIVAEVRKYADETDKDYGSEMMLIDSAAGVGCPVIASLTGTDYIVAVTEPTPSALHDLKRVLYLAEHFNIPCGVVLNKYDLAEKFCEDIKEYLADKNVPIIGKVPYRKDFVKATIEMKPVTEVFPEYKKAFKEVRDVIMENKP